MRLLSVDWDYFVPTYPADPDRWFLYDWAMKDSPFHRTSAIWVPRGAGFLRNKLPLPDTTGLEKTFWSRFKFARGAKLYYADSHLFAADIADKGEIVDEVWNFDAHHDLGYHGTQDSILAKRLVTCDNWLGWYKHAGAKVRVLYPGWRPDARKEEGKPVFPGIRKIDNDQPVAVPFHAVYLCRSSSWSPPWLDEKFKEFLEACPLKEPVNLQPDYDARSPREFSVDELHEFIAQWEALEKAKSQLPVNQGLSAS